MKAYLLIIHSGAIGSAAMTQANCKDRVRVLPMTKEIVSWRFPRSTQMVIANIFAVNFRITSLWPSWNTT